MYAKFEKRLGILISDTSFNSTYYSQIEICIIDLVYLIGNCWQIKIKKYYKHANNANCENFKKTRFA